MRLMPYKLGSKSGKALAQALGIKRLRREKGKFSNRYNHVIVNWGCTTVPYFHTPRTVYLNHPDAANVASNKLLAFKKMKDSVRIPEFTTDPHEVREWLRAGKEDGEPIAFARKYLRAHSGKGIVPLYYGDALPAAPLFTRYVKKAEEYHVHVFTGKVMEVQMKRKRQEVDNAAVNYKVRNLAGGWVFCREGFDVPLDVKVQSLSAVQTLGLDFGAVDVGYNKQKGEATVFEVNTACGLEGTTVERYAAAIRGG